MGRTGNTCTVRWTWQGHEVELGIDRTGTGPMVLLLPALSSISTRHEMDPLATRLADEYQTVTADWPGFGDRPRPQLDWTPEAYRAYLTFLLEEVVPAPHAVIAR